MSLSGLGPLSVTFTDTSTPTGAITYWHWDFGDGDTSEEQNPVHTYDPGEYTVTLSVASAKGIDTVTGTVSVEDPNNRNITSLTLMIPSGHVVGGTDLTLSVRVLPLGDGRTVNAYWRKDGEPESEDELIGAMSYNSGTERYEVLWTFPSCPELGGEEDAFLHIVGSGGDGVEFEDSLDAIALTGRGC